jgi:hypothetical protein
MTDDEVHKLVLAFTNGRWASLYDMVERIATADRIYNALRALGHDGEHIVRKRNPENWNEDPMLREYRTYAYGCKECGNRLTEFHKVTCSHAGRFVTRTDCKEW